MIRVLKNKIYVPKQPAINSGACICVKRLFYRSIVQDLGFYHGSITGRVGDMTWYEHPMSLKKKNNNNNNNNLYTKTTVHNHGQKC